MGLLLDFISILEILYENLNVMRDKWDHFGEKIAKIVQSGRLSWSDPVRYKYSGFKSKLVKIFRSDHIQKHNTGSRSNVTDENGFLPSYFMQPYIILKCFCIVPRHLCLYNRIWDWFALKLHAVSWPESDWTQCTSKNIGERKIRTKCTVPHMRTEIKLLLNVITRQKMLTKLNLPHWNCTARRFLIFWWCPVCLTTRHSIQRQLE